MNAEFKERPSEGLDSALEEDADPTPLMQSQLNKCKSFLQKERCSLWDGPSYSLNLGPPTEGKTHTLVLDLDKTLLLSFPLSSVDRSPLTTQYKPPKRSPDAEKRIPPKDGFPHNIYKVWYRPGMREFLDEVSKLYEIVIFSSGMKNYVEGMVKLIDPDDKCVSYVFSHTESFRYKFTKTVDAVVYDDGELLVKNIEDFFEGHHPRSEKRLVCVDDMLTNFLPNLSNMVPISPYLGDPDDRELLEVADFLKALVGVEDVREEIKKRYNFLACEELDRSNWVNMLASTDSSSDADI